MKQITIKHSGVGPFLRGQVITEEEFAEVILGKPSEDGYTSAQLARVTENLDRLVANSAVIVSAEVDDHTENDAVLDLLSVKTLSAAVKDLGYSGPLPKTSDGLVKLIKQLKLNKAKAEKITDLAASIGDEVAPVAPARPANQFKAAAEPAALVGAEGPTFTVESA